MRIEHAAGRIRLQCGCNLGFDPADQRISESSFGQAFECSAHGLRPVAGVEVKGHGFFEPHDYFPLA